MVSDMFSKRQKQLRGEVSDVYVYDDIPQSLRVQIIHILRDTIGSEEEFRHFAGVRRGYAALVDILCREYGLFSLGNKNDCDGRDHITELFNFIHQQADHEKILDAVQLAFRFIDEFTRKVNYLSRTNAWEQADAAIAELNIRFQEHSVGYRFEEREIIRVDSEFLHLEVVKPALTLIHAPQFDGAQAEFLKAHEHYRHGNSKEALAECLKSLESTIKSICAKRKWAHHPNATSKALIDVLFEKGLIPAFWTSHFTGLRSMLESGVPTARNRLGGHGQGVEITEVPMHIVVFAIHQTAAAIVFLVTAEKALA